jgi:predicted nucleotidyltransferase
MSHPNLELLEIAAVKLRPLLPEIVFVGGCATGLLITDPGAAALRRTYDVDVISEIASYAEYAVFSERLRLLGFNEDSREGAPLCRWQHGELVLDVMPLDASILGFSNRWYPDALHTAVEVELNPELTIKAITAPHFLATKIEAFRGRGEGDYFASHDLEDFIAVIDGRPSLLQEIEASSPELRTFLAEAVRGLLAVSRCATGTS